ncbi:MAG: HDOD domain-containing protein [Bacteroidetes bacterium]|nr:HDOD domain-containing protein [Bacteroidota bacterium]
MGNKVLRDLVARMSSLPRLSSLYLELIKEIQSPDSKLSTIGTIISKDVGMTAKILQLVNSAHFGLPTRVSSAQHAARLLGLETIKALVLTHDVFSQFEHINLGSFSLSALMEHSQKVGSFARLITKNENPEESLVNDAFISGN